MSALQEAPLPTCPTIVLVRPQLAENIGAVARAMWNCGLDELRLVAPRQGWPNAAAYPSASGAGAVLDRARVFAAVADAVADLGVVYASTARLRDMVKPFLTPRQAALEWVEEVGRGTRVGILFGPERTGLDNDEVVPARKIVCAPLNPEFTSLNLAQAVLLFAYEWRLAGGSELPRREPRTALEEPATQEDLANFFEHLEDELESGNFFAIREKKPAMLRNIRNIFSRAVLTRQEVRTLHGIVKALTGRPKGGVKSPRS